MGYLGGSALGLRIVPQLVGYELFGLFLLTALLAMWWIARVGRSFFVLYPPLVRLLLWVSIAITADTLLMLFMLWIPVPTILRLGAMGGFFLAAEDQVIHLYLTVVLPCGVGTLLIGGVMIARRLLQERKARRQRTTR